MYATYTVPNSTALSINGYTEHGTWHKGHKRSEGSELFAGRDHVEISEYNQTMSILPTRMAPFILFIAVEPLAP